MEGVAFIGIVIIGAIILFYGKQILSGLGVLATYVVVFTIPIGWIYWFWLAIKFGNFFAFAFAFFPFTAPLSSVLGGWCFWFGVPDWAASLFF